MSKTQPKKVLEWIEGEGYGLEMRVARCVAEAGLSVLQSVAYQDPATSKQREIDVLAFEPDWLGDANAGIAIPIECKRSRKPWVLLSATHQLKPEDRLARMLATPRGRRILPRLGGLLESPLFEIPEFLGYSLAVGLGSGNQDWAYNAVRSVVSAAEGWLAGMGGSASVRLTAFAWPALVLEGDLFQAVLGEDGEIDVREISRGVLAWRRPRDLLFLEVATEEGFEGALPGLGDAVKAFASQATSVLGA